jgi:hypothetical protein
VSIKESSKRNHHLRQGSRTTKPENKENLNVRNQRSKERKARK